MSDKHIDFPGLMGLIEATGGYMGILEALSLFNELLYLRSSVVLRIELKAEFEKQGLSTEDSRRATEVFFEMVEKGELR